MGLSKQADGLPRFMLDCGWWRNGKKWRRRSLAEMGLHQAGISHANEHGTDGVLPGPPDELAESLSLPAKEVAKVLPLLIARGVWTQRKDGDFEIVDFLEHNPSRAEVAADRRRRQLASAHANHQRHHVRKKITDPDCQFCSDSESDSDSGQESQSDSDMGSEADSNNGCNGLNGTDGTEQGFTSAPAAPVAEDDPPDPIPLRRPRPPDPLWDAVMAACAVDPNIPDSARGAYNRAVGDLRRIGATPDDVQARAAVFRRRWPGVSLTPTALARRWAECAEHARPMSAAEAAVARRKAVNHDR